MPLHGSAWAAILWPTLAATAFRSSETVSMLTASVMFTFSDRASLSGTIRNSEFSPKHWPAGFMPKRKSVWVLLAVQLRLTLLRWRLVEVSTGDYRTTCRGEFFKRTI